MPQCIVHALEIVDVEHHECSLVLICTDIFLYKSFCRHLIVQLCERIFHGALLGSLELSFLFVYVRKDADYLKQDSGTVEYRRHRCLVPAWFTILVHSFDFRIALRKSLSELFKQGDQAFSVFLWKCPVTFQAIRKIFITVERIKEIKEVGRVRNSACLCVPFKEYDISKSLYYIELFLVYIEFSVCRLDPCYVWKYRHNFPGLVFIPDIVYVHADPLGVPAAAVQLQFSLEGFLIVDLGPEFLPCLARHRFREYLENIAPVISFKLLFWTAYKPVKTFICRFYPPLLILTDIADYPARHAFIDQREFPVCTFYDLRIFPDRPEKEEHKWSEDGKRDHNE